MHLSQLRTQQFHAVQKYTKKVHFSPQGISTSVADACVSFETKSFTFTHPLCKTSWAFSFRCINIFVIFEKSRFLFPLTLRYSKFGFWQGLLRCDISVHQNFPLILRVNIFKADHQIKCDQFFIRSYNFQKATGEWSKFT
jgi:hypothetical protein